jgi:pSer/pThr/pTyr-binding forkhead associated (FHA) protein
MRESVVLFMFRTAVHNEARQPRADRLFQLYSGLHSRSAAAGAVDELELFDEDDDDGEPGEPCDFQRRASSGTFQHREKLGVCLSEYSIGRAEACHLRIPDMPNISRRHCQLALKHTEEGSYLVAYDDGSLSGTTLNGQTLGVGLGAAMRVQPGDVLRLGFNIVVTLQAISPVLHIDDHVGLAAFFEALGERQTAQTLRRVPRHTEQIISRLSFDDDRHSFWEMLENLDANSGTSGDPIDLPRRFSSRGQTLLPERDLVPEAEADVSLAPTQLSGAQEPGTGE